ncbi:MAG: HAD family phosphatase [Cyclobacteriaceae bacterium]
MSKIALLFDMDGVIVDNHQFHYAAWVELCAKYDRPLNEALYRENLNGRTLNEVVKYIFGEDTSQEQVKKIGKEKESLYRQLYQPHLSPTLGLMQFLSEAGKNNIPMVVGTSAPLENVHFTLNGLGIWHHFKDILDERAVTVGKPNPEIYQKCAAAAGLPNSQCVVFEDAVSGIKAGKSAGSKVIGLATSHTCDELDADLIIDNFRDLSLEQVRELIES